MNKILLFSICTLLIMSLHAQVYTEEMEDSHYLEAPPSPPVVPPNVQFSTLTFKGTFSHSANSNGFISVRDAAFYNDIAYMISGDGKKILMTNSSGVPVANPFASLTFNEAMRIRVNDEYVFVLDLNSLRFYSKTGVLRHTIQFTSADPWYQYFWVKNKQEIWFAAPNNRIAIYNYSTRTLLRTHTPVNRIYNTDYIRNDGNKMYKIYSGEKLIVYESTGGVIRERVIDTPNFKNLSRAYHLAAFTGNQSVWFDYENRSRAVLADANFNIIRHINFLPASKNPTFDDMVIESGTPMLRVHYSQGKVYVINIRPHAVEFYRLE